MMATGRQIRTTTRERAGEGPKGRQWVAGGDASRVRLRNTRTLIQSVEEATVNARGLARPDVRLRLFEAYLSRAGYPGVPLRFTLISTHYYDPPSPKRRLRRAGGLHRRIRKVVAGDPDVTYDYYYNTSLGRHSLGVGGWQVLEVRKDSNADPLKQYVWDLRYIDAPVLRWRDADTDGSAIEKRYYTYDANFNVTGLVEEQASATVVERYAYDPYGNVHVLDADWSADADGASDFDNELLYCGYRFDADTGLFHVRFRFYHPTLGRWMQRDPLEYQGKMNLYSSATNPTIMVDPFGTRESTPPPWMEHATCKRFAGTLIHISGGSPLEFGPVRGRWGYQITGEISLSKCRRCCSRDSKYPGRTVEDTIKEVAVSGRFSAEGGSFYFSLGSKCRGFKAEGYLGLKLELFGEGRGSAMTATDRCNGAGKEKGRFCLTASFGGSIYLGGMLTIHVGWGWFGFDKRFGVEGYGRGSGSATTCWALPSLRWERTVNLCVHGTVGITVALAFEFSFSISGNFCKKYSF